MPFELLGDFSDVETIAVGRQIRELQRLQKMYGRARWRKLKGIARIRLNDGTIHKAEVHKYEAAGTGKREFKLNTCWIDGHGKIKEVRHLHQQL